MFRFSHRDSLLADLAKIANKKRMRKAFDDSTCARLEHEDHVIHIELRKAQIASIWQHIIVKHLINYGEKRKSSPRANTDDFGASQFSIGCKNAPIRRF